MPENSGASLQKGDALEKRAVAEILKVLPPDHEARKAFDSGANTLLVAELVSDPDISQRLRRVFLDGFERLLHRAKQACKE
ncbi:MAG: hypothetical protein JO035_04865 [Betaproteobacteria bacterium]|nr:hypothetical protein [Betaproteobacteria bacterium]